MIISLGKVTRIMYRHRGEKQNLARGGGKAEKAGAEALAVTEDKVSFSILWNSDRSPSVPGTWCSLRMTSTSSMVPPHRTLADSMNPVRPRAHRCLASKGSRRRQERNAGEASYFQMQRPEEVSQSAMRKGPLMEAKIQESEWTQQRSCTPNLALSEEEEESNSSQRRTRLQRKSQIAMRPWRSPTARRRWEAEGSSTARRSRGRDCGIQRTEVTNGAR